jgi:hypothetical protein
MSNFIIGICALVTLCVVSVVRSFWADIKVSRVIRAELEKEAQNAPPREIRTGPDLSPGALRRINILFPKEEDREWAKKLLYEQCGNNLKGPFEEADDRPESADRLRFSALKYSRGSRTRLEKVIQLGQTDWRDLLASAGFAGNPDKYLKWEPKPPRESGSRHRFWSGS